jgi:hypothetical protein
MQFGPHQDPEDITKQLLQLVQEAPVDEIMFFYFAEEQNNGHDTLEEIQQWIDRSRPYRQVLKEAGVITSLNPWHSVLHCDRHRTLKPGQNWQNMIGSKGGREKAVVCFLDTAWQEYFFETLRMYVKEGFRVVWIDDDIRYHNHGDLHWGGCFCPLHVAEFNKHAQTNATREEIVDACLQPGTPHPWREIWMDMWQETILKFLDDCRKILEEGDTEMGLMSSSMEAHGAEGRRWEEWWDVFGGGKPPVHRSHFWCYENATGPTLINGIAMLDQNRTIQPDDVENGPEIENFTYGQWQKSYRQINAQMSVAHILGSTNLNISLFDFMGNRPDDESSRAKFLKQVRPNMDFLADTFPMTMKSVGVGVPWHQDMGRTIHTTEGNSWFELQCACRGWAHWLGSAGIAFSARPQEKVNAIAGQLASSFDEETLKKWLSAGVLLDGEAAAVICERGLGHLIGLKSGKMVNQDEILYSIEECRDEEFSLRLGAQMSVNDREHTRCLFQGELAEGAQPISDIRDPRQHIVGHGAFLFENELGGRVAVVPWNAKGKAPMMDVRRACQLKHIVKWLARGTETGSIDGIAWLFPQFLKDENIWRGAVWNAGPDETTTFHINRPEGMPPISEAWHLTPAGERLAATIEEDTITLDRPLYQWEVVIVK